MRKTSSYCVYLRTLRGRLLVSHRNDRGSALATVLILTTAITVVIGSMLMLLRLQARLVHSDLNQLRAYYAAEAGIHKAIYLLSGNEGRDWTWRPDSQKVALFDSQTAHLTVKAHGGYLEVTSEATVKRRRQVVTATVGQAMPAQFDQAVILGGQDFPLVVTGDNRIIGDVTVGKSGVKPGTIRGTGFTGDRLVTGRINKVTPLAMPAFDAQLLSDCMADLAEMLDRIEPQDGPMHADSTARYTGAENGYLVDGRLDAATLDSVLSHSRMLLSPAAIVLAGKHHISQPITIVARDSLELGGSLVFDDALLYAGRKITIRDKVRGRIQAITKGKIRTLDQVQFAFPSLLYSTGHIDGGSLSGAIEIGGNSRITGALMLHASATDSLQSGRRNTRITIDPAATVVGIVYSDNHTTVSGTVHGLVTADHFYLYEPPTTYLNWLKDATIDRTQLPPGFVLPLLFGVQPQLRIIAMSRER